jgi:hypothetical protein
MLGFINTSDYIALKNKMVNERRIGKGHGRKR